MKNTRSILLIGVIFLVMVTSLGDVLAQNWGTQYLPSPTYRPEPQSLAECEEEVARVDQESGYLFFQLCPQGACSGDCPICGGGGYYPVLGWSERLAGMQITGCAGADGKPETVLVGRLADQAALSGVMNTLYECHLPVISVECIGANHQQ